MIPVWKFTSNETYSEAEIRCLADKVEIILSDTEGDYLSADTPEREYIFFRSGNEWKLNHTWGHFIISK